MIETSEKLRQRNFAAIASTTSSPESAESLLDLLGRVCRLTVESLRGVSPVRTSATQARVPGSAETDHDSGSRCAALLASYDRTSWSWRTSQLCLDGGLEEFSETWPRSGMWDSGTAYRLPTLAHRTSGTGCGSSRRDGTDWPTPRATHVTPGETRVKALKETGKPAKRKDGGEYHATLEEMVQVRPMLHTPTATANQLCPSMWPTPIATEATKCPSESLSRAVRPDLRFSFWPTPAASAGLRSNMDGQTLLDAVEKQRRERPRGAPSILGAEVYRRTLPTPQARDYKGATDPEKAKANGQSVHLNDVVKMLPTPTARDWRSGKASAATHAKNARPLSEKIGGQLNPTFVEWLMNYPKDWTSLESHDHPTEQHREWLEIAEHEGHWWSEWPDIPRVSTGVPARVDRLKCLGNAVVPQCVEYVWRVYTESSK